MESWKDLAKLFWNEMNPIEGYTSRSHNVMLNNWMGPFDDYLSWVFKNDVNKIIPMNSQERSMIKTNIKDLQKVNIPSNTGDLIKQSSSGLYDTYVLPNEYVKSVNSKWDKMFNKIPTVTMGKIVNKLYNIPGVAPTIKFITNPYVDIGTTVGSMMLDERNDYLEKQKSINKLRQMKSINDSLRNKPMVLQGRVEYNR